MDNLEIYNKFRAVPKDALKDFDNGSFKGTDINTMWRIKCLTEQFGVVGFGWTIKVLRTWSETINDEVLAFAEIEMKVKIDGEWSEPFTATGGNKMCSYIKSKDYYKASDEAYKMAITDAFGVACKYLGIGADVYWANDKSKYTENDTQTPKSSPQAEKTQSKGDKPKEDKKPINDTKKKMTLEDAKKMKFIGRGQKEYVVGELNKDYLLLLKDYTKLPDLLEAVNLVLEDIAKREYENSNKE